jgi:hypothetical protein
MVSYEPEDHCCLRDPPLDVGKCQPPDQPRHRLPWSCESESRGVITRVEFPPAVHQTQGVLDGLKTADVADAASLRSNSGLGGIPRWGVATGRLWSLNGSAMQLESPPTK